MKPHEDLSDLIQHFKGRNLDHNQRYRIRCALSPFTLHWSKSFYSHSDEELIERMEKIVVKRLTDALLR